MDKPPLGFTGHIDTVPLGAAPWKRDAFGASLEGGRLYGRGASDMKCGTSCSIWTYIYLHRIRDRLKGRLTLTVVSDEETFGPWGTRYLMEHHADEVLGDCCLNGEPSSPHSTRFGEKGPLWLEFTILTAGAHGAYTHATGSATKIAMSLAGRLEELTAIRPELSDNIFRAVDAGRSTMDRAMGKGAGAIVEKRVDSTSSRTFRSSILPMSSRSSPSSPERPIVRGRGLSSGRSVAGRTGSSAPLPRWSARATTWRLRRRARIVVTPMPFAHIRQSISTI